ncbi:MAG: protein-L-isoaspartate(D-aspartate) O-methyltransferase [Sandaracinaceae bacterium]|nr:protein-L-isoaspartate(D-aspartate) O-methyltransferase [Sandaracinaceae bacterium]
METATERSLVDATTDAGVRDARVLDAIRNTPRHRFVPPELAHRAYEDRPLPIAHRQVTTQPSLVARMLAALALEGKERVLEVGAGHGWQTALLSRLASRVWSVELWPDLAGTARGNIEREGIDNVTIVTGDGTRGLPEHAPFDAIIVAAAFPTVPPPLVDQLAPAGRLVQPIGPSGAERVMVFERSPEGLTRPRLVTYASFVPLYGAYGYGDSPD